MSEMRIEVVTSSPAPMPTLWYEERRLDAIAERCVELIAKAKQLPADEITPVRTLDELDFDSLDKVSLAFDIEEAFHIRVSDSELLTLHSVSDIIAGVKQKVANRTAEGV
jgi:acyl carrier protein